MRQQISWTRRCQVLPWNRSKYLSWWTALLWEHLEFRRFIWYKLLEGLQHAKYSIVNLQRHFWHHGSFLSFCSFHSCKSLTEILLVASLALGQSQDNLKNMDEITHYKTIKIHQSVNNVGIAWVLVHYKLMMGTLEHDLKLRPPDSE